MKAQINTITADQFVGNTSDESCSLVFDVRSPAEVANESYQPSQNIPLDQFTTDRVNACIDHERGQSEDTVIYLLCGTGKRAEKAAEVISGQLSNDVYIIEGGISALKSAGANVLQGSGKMISLERQVRIAAGVIILIGTVLGALVSPVFYGLSAFVGAGLVFAGVTDTCGMAMLLAKMPWNNR